MKDFRPEELLLKAKIAIYWNKSTNGRKMSKKLEKAC
jgi:hypothetical protein